MSALLKWTGLRMLVSFYRYIYLNQPRLTALAGAVLVLGVGAVHAVEAPEHYAISAYLGILFVANAVGTLVAAVGIGRGAMGWGWMPRTLAGGRGSLAIEDAVAFARTKARSMQFCIQLYGGSASLPTTTR